MRVSTTKARKSITSRSQRSSSRRPISLAFVNSVGAQSTSEEWVVLYGPTKPASLPNWDRLIEYHGLVAITENTTLQMPCYRSRQHRFLDIPALLD
jgi:hypothetical protein